MSGSPKSLLAFMASWRFSLPSCGTLGVLAVAAGCASTAAPAAVSAPASPLRLDGVSLEVPAAMPPVTSHATSGGLVALRVPVSSDAVAGLLHAFFDAWQRESIDDLTALLSADAGPIEARARGSRVLVEGWRQRLRAHEYGRLAGVELFQPERVEVWEPDEVGAAVGPVRVDVRPGELAVRVPVEVPAVAGDRLFGDAVLMLLRQDEGKLRIAAYGEIEGR